MTSRDSDAPSWESLEREAFSRSEGPVNLVAAVCGAVVTTAPLVVGAITKNHSFGLFCALGGLNTALVMGSADRPTRCRWGVFMTASGSAAVVVTSLTQGSTWLAVIAVVVWASMWALLRALGPQGALVGFTTTAVFIIVGGIDRGSSHVGSHLVAYALGCAGALGIMMISRGTSRAASVSPILWSQVRGALMGPGIVRRHAFRVGIVAGIGTAIYRIASLTFGYWIPLTGVAVIQPDAHASRIRAIQRGAGTLVGTAVVALATMVTHNAAVLIVAVFVASGALFALKDRSYFWLTMLLTPTVLLMISTVQFAGWSIAVTRVVNTAFGLVLALAVAELSLRWSSAPASPSPQT